MPSYLVQVAYNSTSLAALIKKPQDRITTVGKSVEKLGGRVESGWFSFGDYDVTVILEMPDNVSAAALSMAFGADGGCKSIKTTPLISMGESVAAMKKAAACGYKPAK